MAKSPVKHLTTENLKMQMECPKQNRMVQPIRVLVKEMNEIFMQSNAILDGLEQCKTRTDLFQITV